MKSDDLHHPARYNGCMAKDKPQPKRKPKPPPKDPIQSALDAVERATGEKLAETPDCETDDPPKIDDH